MSTAAIVVRAYMRSSSSCFEQLRCRQRTIREMRYLVTARVKPGRRAALARAIDQGTLGAGSIAGDEYFRNMADARELDDGRVQWVEVCYCATPLAEEREYWERFFALDKVQDA